MAKRGAINGKLLRGDMMNKEAYVWTVTTGFLLKAGSDMVGMRNSIEILNLIVFQLEVVFWL